MIGTKEQVLKQAVYFAGACEGGGLQPYGRHCTPEAYIRRIRRLVEEPSYLQHGWWSAELRVDAMHAVVDDVRKLGIEPEIRQRHGQEQAVVSFPCDAYADFFRLIDKYGTELPTWCFAEVGGLPSS